MGVLRELFAGSFNNSVNNPLLWEPLDYTAARRTTSGERIGPISSYQLAAYFAVIRVIAEDCGKLPWSVYKKRGDGGRDEVTDHAAYEILHNSFSPEHSSQEGRELLVQWALGWGGGIAEIQYTRGSNPSAIHPIEPNRVQILRDDRDELFYRIKPTVAGGRTVDLAASDVFHIRGFGSIENGYSLAAYAAECTGKGLAAQRFGAAYFGNGMAPSLILKHPQNLSEEAQNHLLSSMERSHVGSASQQRKTLVLEEGMEVEAISINPHESEWLGSQQFTVEELCRFARVNPNKVQHWLRTTFNNVSEANIDHVGDTLMPWFRRLECEADRKLLTKTERDNGFFTRINATALLRGDPEKRAAFYATMQDRGNLNNNEIRALEDMNPRPGGNNYTIPENMRLFDENGEEIPRVAKESEPVDEEPLDDESAADDGDNPPEDPPDNIVPGQRLAVIRQTHTEMFRGLIIKAFRLQDRTAWQKKRKQMDEGEFDEWWHEWIPKHAAQTRESLYPSVRSLASLVDTLNGGLVSAASMGAADKALDEWVEFYKAYSRGNAEDPPDSRKMAERLTETVINAVQPLRQAAA